MTNSKNKNRLPIKVDFNKLESDFLDAQNSEDRYQRENDAKFRAIAQKVPTYEDFSEMVKAAHLKPLDKSDSVTVGQNNAVWNNIIGNKAIPSPSCADDPVYSSKVIDLPANNHELQSLWRVYSKTPKPEKYRLQFALIMNVVHHDAVHRIWKGGCTMLGDIFIAIHEACSSLDATEIPTLDICKLLSDMANLDRHSLNIAFLCKSELSAISSVIDDIQLANEKSTNSEDNAKIVDYVTDIRKSYCL